MPTANRAARYRRRQGRASPGGFTAGRAKPAPASAGPLAARARGRRPARTARWLAWCTNFRSAARCSRRGTDAFPASVVGALQCIARRCTRVRVDLCLTRKFSGPLRRGHLDRHQCSEAPEICVRRLECRIVSACARGNHDGGRRHGHASGARPTRPPRQSAAPAAPPRSRAGSSGPGHRRHRSRVRDASAGTSRPRRSSVRIRPARGPPDRRSVASSESTMNCRRGSHAQPLRRCA